MSKSKAVLAALGSVALSALPITANAQERQPAFTEEADELNGAPGITVLGYVLGIALAVIIAVEAFNDDDQETPTSP